MDSKPPRTPIKVHVGRQTKRKQIAYSALEWACAEGLVRMALNEIQDQLEDECTAGHYTVFKVETCP